MEDSMWFFHQQPFASAVAYIYPIVNPNVSPEALWTDHQFFIYVSMGAPTVQV
jgi:hypothetical protein